ARLLGLKRKTRSADPLRISHLVIEFHAHSSRANDLGTRCRNDHVIRSEKVRSEKYADYQSVGSVRTQEDRQQDEESSLARQPAKARGLCPRLHANTEEAELGAAKSRARPAHERDRSHDLHPGRWSQPSGALAGADSRRPRQGSARRPLSRGARNAGCRRRPGAHAGPFEIRREETEEGVTGL